MKKMLLIFGISLFFRFLYLDVIPVSLAHDEIDNIIQAQSVIQTGTDIEGTWKPLRFLPTINMMGELAPLINVPMLSIFPQSILSSRATSALLSSIYPLLLIVLLSSIGVSGSVATTAAFLLAVSPWHIIFSRTALEQPASLFFYTMSWIFLANYFKSRKIDAKSVWNILFFVLTYTFGFFTYHGFKFSLPILTGVFVIYFSYFKGIKFNLLKALVPILYIGLLFGHILLNGASYSSRSVEIIFGQTERFSKEVDLSRRVSLAPNYLKEIFSNKYISLAQAIGDKYLYVISPDLLFQHGENNGVFALWTIGYLYLFTLPFLFLGLMYILKNRTREQLLILVLLLLSPLASVIHVNNSYAFRSAIYFVLLNVVLAYGFVYFYKFITSRFKQYLLPLTILISVIAVVSVAHFSYLYYYVSPINNSNSYFFSERVMAQYVNLASSKKILIIDPQPRYVYSSIILSRRDVAQADMASFNHQYGPVEDDVYNYQNITVTRDCPTGIDLGYDTVIIAKELLRNSSTCLSIKDKLSKNPTLVSSLVSAKDSGEERIIVGDLLCQDVKLRSYVNPLSLDDLKLDKLSTHDFCSIWVVKQ